MGTGLKFLFEEEVTMKQGTNLGSQIGRWIILAAVVAYWELCCSPSGPSGRSRPRDVKQWALLLQTRKRFANYEYDENGTGQVARLSALERDVTQVVKVWELVSDAGTTTLPDDPSTTFPDYGHFRIDAGFGRVDFQESAQLREPRVGGGCQRGHNEIRR